MIEQETSFRTELATAGLESYNLRQLRALEWSSESSLHTPSNTPALPSYSREGLWKLQDQHPMQYVFKIFWEQKQKPNFKKRKHLEQPVLSLMKHWSHIKRDFFIKWLCNIWRMLSTISAYLLKDQSVGMCA